MWVSAANGDLVNLGNMESVQTVGLSVNAQINADRWITLVQAANHEQAADYVEKIARALAAGVTYLDIRTA